MGLRNIVRCQFWAIVFYNLFVQFGFALFTFFFAALMIGLGYSFVISMFLLPGGVLLLLIYGFLIRFIVLFDLKLMSVVTGAKVPKYPDVLDIEGRSLSALKQNGCYPWLVSIIKDMYVLKISFYYVFIRLPLATIAFFTTLILIVTGVCGIAQIFVVAFCHHCYHQKGEFPTKAGKWFLSSYGGGVIIFIIGIILLTISTFVIPKLSEIICKYHYYYLSIDSRGEFDQEVTNDNHPNFKFLENHQIGTESNN